ncbi:hypothetical protein QBK99_15135 [Corticibacterium sp. UT-5YL-CI-8]|nr:hypothetical protein [Tianweitania sp. UT-5YL-CI-8]
MFGCSTTVQPTSKEALANDTRSAKVGSSRQVQRDSLGHADDRIVQISLPAVLVVGFFCSLRFSPLVIIPLGIVSVVAAIFFDLKISGSTALASLGLVVALNVGYLLGAVVYWRLRKRERLRSILSVRRFTR